MPLDLDGIVGPIDPTDPKYTPLLAQLQGNILKSHGRNYTVNLFLTFQAGQQDKVKSWIGSFTRRYVTSALRQMQESAEFKANKLSGRIFANLSFSAAGYEYLGLDKEAFVEKPRPAEVRFAEGIQAARTELSDPDPKTWSVNASGNVHALILLADEFPVADPTKRLAQVLHLVKEELAHEKIVAHMEEVVGIGLRDEHNQPLEHFGYRDGISQPLFFVQDVEEERLRFGTSAWDPSASLSLVLVPDPFSPEPESFGSYFVFRKLEQNVLEFKKHEDALGKLLKNGERAGAMVVGRFENGVPIEVTGSEDAIQFRDFNDFNYHDDLTAARCPFQGHIRKTNPRGDTARVLLPQIQPNQPIDVPLVDEQERGHRIARRGITFGDRKLNKDGQLIPPELKPNGTLDPPVTGPVGLLFQCYQSSIPNQFGFMQKLWANNPDFPSKATGQDPVIGQGDPTKPAQQWNPVYDDPANRKASAFGGFVTMKGGEFFFTPSIPFLLGFSVATPSVQADQKENYQRAVTVARAKAA